MEMARIRSPRKRRASFHGVYQSLAQESDQKKTYSQPNFLRQASTSSGKRLVKVNKHQ